MILSTVVVWWLFWRKTHDITADVGSGKKGGEETAKPEDSAKKEEEEVDPKSGENVEVEA
jgi:hypothetical protein